MSLSHLTYLAKKPFTISIYAGIAKIESVGDVHPRSGGGTRSKVTVFTKQSRKRLLEKLAMMRDCENGFFVTLTYPGSFEYTWKECKAHLAAFRKRLLYYCPKARAMWRMDLKRRKSGDSAGQVAPHYHMLIFGINPLALPKFRQWVHTVWSEIANYHDRNCPKLRTQVDEIHSHKHAVSYAAKYLSKVDTDEDTGFGRYWGLFGNIDDTASIVIHISAAQLITFRRYVRSWLKSKKKTRIARMVASIREDFGFSVFGIGDAEPDARGDPLALLFALISVS